MQHEYVTIRQLRNLILNGGDVNAVGAFGLAPIVCTNKLAVVKLLLEHGADPNAQDDNGHTVLHAHPEWCELLISYGADINARDLELNTPLHYVRSEKDARVLLLNGADVDARDVFGNTPLHKVLSKKIAHVLIAHGADVRARNMYGITPLHQARSGSIAQVLITHGADVHARDDAEGETPLLWVIADDDRAPQQSLGVVTELLQHGVDVNSANASGETPLWNVVMSGKYYGTLERTALIHLLLAHGADPTIGYTHTGNGVPRIALQDPTVQAWFRQRMVEEQAIEALGYLYPIDVLRHIVRVVYGSA